MRLEIVYSAKMTNCAKIETETFVRSALDCKILNMSGSDKIHVPAEKYHPTLSACNSSGLLPFCPAALTFRKAFTNWR